MVNNLIPIYFLASSAILLIFGGLGLYTNTIIVYGIINCFIFIGLLLIQNKTVKWPKGFLGYIIFLISLVVNYLILNGEMYYFWLFLSGSCIWLLFYNYQNLFAKYFLHILVIQGVAMGVFYFLSVFSGVRFLPMTNLYLPVSPTVLHNHIGDLWAIILVGIISQTVAKKSLWLNSFVFYGLILTGIVFIGISLSRSALFTLGFGLLYVFQMSQSFAKYRVHLLSALFLLILVFFFFGFTKTTLFSRPYFFDAIKSLIESPQGIGVGNFKDISKETSLAHNFLLEIMIGMGYFSAIFFHWLYGVLSSFTKNRLNITYQALFLAILVNFSFDTTYVIPSVVWLWFASLALIQIKEPIII